MQALLVIHNLLRWFILLFGIWTVLTSLSGLMSKRVYSPGDSQANFLFTLGMDLQLLVGLGLYFSGVWFDRLKHLGDNMKDTNLRFFTMEHEFMMILAWILVHVGRVVVKKAFTSPAKFKRSLIFFGITLLLILIAMPWPFRDAVARPWFRWFN
ncbi:MAG: hypothetical protein ABI416_05610 [Ginsengibacter sp.]